MDEIKDVTKLKQSLRVAEAYFQDNLSPPLIAFVKMFSNIYLEKLNPSSIKGVGLSFVVNNQVKVAPDFDPKSHSWCSGLSMQRELLPLSGFRLPPKLHVSFS